MIAIPYETMIDVIEEATLQPTGERELKILYRNNVTEW